MNFRLSPESKPSGGARKVATAVLLAALFMVPMMPMGSATNPSAFEVDVFGGSVVGSTTAEYNFTFTFTDSDVEKLRIGIPGFTFGQVEDANLPTYFESNFSKATGYVEFEASEAAASGTYWVRINETQPQGYAGTKTATLTIYNATAANGTKTDTFTVSAAALDVDLDSDEDDEMVLASGAITDYHLEVVKWPGFAGSQWVNFTFPSGFDLSDAAIGTEEAVGQKIGYKTSGGDPSPVLIEIKDVENPSISVDATYIVTAVAYDGSGNTIATGSFEIDLIVPDILVKHTSGSTRIKEGGIQDNITVELRSEPSASVTVNIDGGDQMTPSKTALTFTTANWDTAQTVKLTAVDDSVPEGSDFYELTFLSESSDDENDGLDATFNVEIQDNDVGLVIRESGDDTRVEEGDTTGDTYEVVLSTQPKKKVTVDLEVPERLSVDDDSLTFSTSNWNTPQEITVKSARVDDSKYQEDVELTITHTSTSDDDDYDDLELELEVILEDDEHPALGLTDKQIAEANALVKLTVTEEEDDGMFLEWELPDQEDLDDIFESDGEITIHGIQILASNSPYTVLETYEDGDDEFDDAEYLHEFDDGATLRTKYLVTMYFDEDIGLFSDDTAPETTDKDYEGVAFEEALLPWWAWVIIAVVAVVLILLILLAVLSSKSRRAYGDDVDWDDSEPETTKPAKAERAAPKPRKGTHDLECPVCDHQFTVKGKKPIKTECPNCGAKGVLN